MSTSGPAEEGIGLSAEDSYAERNASKVPHLRVMLKEADDSPLDPERLKLIHARDLPNDPIPVPIDELKGEALVGLAREPIQLCVRLKVPNFGEVYCFADNNGKGYTRAADVDFVADAAATRLNRVKDAIAKTRSLGIPFDPELDRHLEAASKPLPKNPGSERTAAAYESLAHGLHAGERFTLNLARHRISRFSAPRKDFGFGILGAHPDRQGAYNERIKELFNFATVAWYSWKDEAAAKTDQPVDYGRMDASVNWCKANQITPKNFGYLYMTRGATPEWIRPPEFSTETTAPAIGRYNSRWGYEDLRSLYPKIVRNTAARYRGQVPYMEVMNEAHDKANLWRMTHAQVLEIARDVFKAAREGDPNIKRQMNHCCLWGEYAKSPNPGGGRRWSPYRFIRDCLGNGVDYEVIGLQLYYPQFDIFEIDRMLNRFKDFKRPMHITEIATASKDTLDPASMRPKTYAPGWHGPWTESTQADWLEAVYTIVYSKPEFEEIGWWDLADTPGHFWQHGGLLNADMTPKEAFHRLRKLQQQWGVPKGMA
ncbi:MAG TPA: endo-1,4-beta-xylanase [Tepidisphaeraceae bacterium]|nr:endo-1,4-beta-xylanase [Tepidisphaeraceae bacterium]